MYSVASCTLLRVDDIHRFMHIQGAELPRRDQISIRVALSNTDVEPSNQ